MLAWSIAGTIMMASAIKLSQGSGRGGEDMSSVLDSSEGGCLSADAKLNWFAAEETSEGNLQ